MPELRRAAAGVCTRREHRLSRSYRAKRSCRPRQRGNVLAALVSFFVPGLGQVLQGRLRDAGRIWLLFLVWTIALFTDMGVTGAISPALGAVWLLLGMAAGFGIYVLNIYDAATFDPRRNRKFLGYLTRKSAEDA